MRILACLLCCAAAGALADNFLLDRVEIVSDFESVSKGKAAADKFLKLIRSKEFHKVLDVVGVAGGPIAGTVTSILKMVIGSDSPQSEELKFAREAFAEINSKLEAFTNEFKEVKSLIDWSAIQVSYGTYERSIRALKDQLQILIVAPKSAIEDLKDLFIMKYEAGFNNAAEKIYDGVVNTDMIFSRNLLEAASKFTRNHRKKVQMFGMGLIQLLLQGVEIQMAYFDLKYANQGTTDYIKKIWDDRMTALKAKMTSFDQLISTRWVTQIREDAQQLVSENQHLNNADLALKLFYAVQYKFYWRYFASIVYDDVNGESKHALTNCRGFTSFEKFGKNVVLASVDKQDSRFDRPRARQLVEALQPTEKEASHILQLLNRASGSSACGEYRLKHVVEESAGVKMVAMDTNLYKERLCVSTFWGTTCYWVTLFG